MAKISTTKKTSAAKKSAVKKTAPEKPLAKVVKKVAAGKQAVAKAAPPAKRPAKVKVAKKTVEPKTPSPKSVAKSELVKKYRSNAKDTGSVTVQTALLTDRIHALSKHLAKHIHDSDSKRGLLIAVGKRRRLLNYVRGNDPKVYEKLIKDLKLKK